MVLTPIFKLEQDERTLTVKIHAPMAKLSDIEICIEDNSFFFQASPYYLRFDIPGPVHNDEETYNYDFSGGEVIVKLQKLKPGLFDGLDLITKLLFQAPLVTIRKPLIEEVPDDQSIDQTDAPLNWFSLQENDVDDVVIASPSYGFANSKSGLFLTESDLTYAVDLSDPDKVTPSKRSSLREADEENKFSTEHYLADFFEPEVWQTMANSHPLWLELKDNSPDFSSEERHRLITLSSRRLPLILPEPSEQVSLYLGLVDLLLGYTYDFRVREGEPMTESGWNIVKLSSTLSWFQVFKSLPSLLITFYRRTLTYPLVRSWRFTSLIKHDVAQLLRHKAVKEWCLKCLLEIRELLIAYPGYHVFAELYLNDYIVWIQTRASQFILNDLGEKMNEFSMKKDLVGLNLKQLERIGKQCLREETIQASMQTLSISNEP